MKRKFGADGGQEDSYKSMYGAPPLESTMLIDTGGIKTGDQCIGSVSSIPVNASVSSGTRLFQYNRFFWNRDLFSFNFNNCAVFIILSFYDGINSITNTMFFPVFLPQTALTTYQSLQSGASFDPKTKHRLIDDLLYYLNGMWAGNPLADEAPPSPREAFPPGQGPLQIGPSFFTYHYKGFLVNPNDHFDFPFFQRDKPPPLKWIKINSNQNIALIKNPDYWNPVDGPPVVDYDCAFQFVNPYNGWTISDGNPTNRIVWVDGSIIVAQSQGGALQSVYRNQGNPNHKGWCGRGAFSIGFAQADDPFAFGAYSDIYEYYENPVLQDLWQNYTTFVGQELGIKMNGAQWSHFVEDHYLSRYCVIAYFLPNFLPSRYVTISSEILARDQKLMVISNSPVLSQPNIMGVQFLTLDSVRTWQDATLSAIVPANKTVGNIGGRTNGNDDTTVINMNPYYSIQTLDFSIIDEWDTPIQNFRTAQNAYVLNFVPYYAPTSPIGLGSIVTGNYVMSYIMGENSFVLDDSGGETANVTTFFIPAWLALLNPLNSISIPPPSQQPLIGPFSCYNSAFFYMLFAISNPKDISGASYVSVPLEFSPSLPYSGNIIHFGRVLGY